MKRNILLSALTLLTVSTFAADSDPKEQVQAAARKLGEKPNYSWKTTVVVPEGSQFRPGPTDGQTEKDGFTHATLSFGENTTQAFFKGDKGVVSNPDGGWETLSELENAEGRRRFLGMIIRNLKTPAKQAEELATGTKDLKKDGNAFSGDLTESTAKALLTFRRGGGDGPSVSNAKGSVKFWLKDGDLSKFEFKVTGTVTFNGNDRDVDRTTTVEIKDVGSTKIEVPEEAKKKLS